MEDGAVVAGQLDHQARALRGHRLVGLRGRIGQRAVAGGRLHVLSNALRDATRRGEVEEQVGGQIDPCLARDELRQLDRLERGDALLQQRRVRLRRAAHGLIHHRAYALRRLLDALPRVVRRRARLGAATAAAAAAAAAAHLAHVGLGELVAAVSATPCLPHHLVGPRGKEVGWAAGRRQEGHLAHDWAVPLVGVPVEAHKDVQLRAELLGGGDHRVPAGGLAREARGVLADLEVPVRKVARPRLGLGAHGRVERRGQDLPVGVDGGLDGRRLAGDVVVQPAPEDLAAEHEKLVVGGGGGALRVEHDLLDQIARHVPLGAGVGRDAAQLGAAPARPLEVLEVRDDELDVERLVVIVDHLASQNDEDAVAVGRAGRLDHPPRRGQLRRDRPQILGRVEGGQQLWLRRAQLVEPLTYDKFVERVQLGDRVARRREPPLRLRVALQHTLLVVRVPAPIPPHHLGPDERLGAAAAAAAATTAAATAAAHLAHVGLGELVAAVSATPCLPHHLVGPRGKEVGWAAGRRQEGHLAHDWAVPLVGVPVEAHKDVQLRAELLGGGDHRVPAGGLAREARGVLADLEVPVRKVARPRLGLGAHGRVERRGQDLPVGVDGGLDGRRLAGDVVVQPAPEDLAAEHEKLVVGGGGGALRVEHDLLDQIARHVPLGAGVGRDAAQLGAAPARPLEVLEVRDDELDVERLVVIVDHLASQNDEDAVAVGRAGRLDHPPRRGQLRRDRPQILGRVEGGQQLWLRRAQLVEPLTYDKFVERVQLGDRVARRREPPLRLRVALQHTLLVVRVPAPIPPHHLGPDEGRHGVDPDSRRAVRVGEPSLVVLRGAREGVAARSAGGGCAGCSAAREIDTGVTEYMTLTARRRHPRTQVRGRRAKYLGRPSTFRVSGCCSPCNLIRWRSSACVS